MLSALAEVIENECHGILGSIYIDTVMEPCRHCLYDDRIRIERNENELVVCYRIELVCIMTLDGAVVAAYNHGDLHYRSVTATEEFTDCRTELELIRVVGNLSELAFVDVC